MTQTNEGATTLERVAGGVLVLGLLAGPVGTHVYWMRGGTWGLGRSTTTTGIRIVALVVVVLLVAAVLVVLARIGLWQQEYVPDRVVRLLAWGLAGFFLLHGLLSLVEGTVSKSLPEWWLYGPSGLMLGLLAFVVARSGRARVPTHRVQLVRGDRNTPPKPRNGRLPMAGGQLSVMHARIAGGASGVILAGALALIVDMFLGWVRVTAYSPGLLDTPLTFDMQATGSGWAGWGVVGGILAIVLLLWHVRSLKRHPYTVEAAAVTAALAAATAGFTIWHALTAEAEVISAEGTLFVTVTRLWPAKAAIGLSAAVVAAATVRLVIAALPCVYLTAPRTRP